mgnify:CR=1 FL=1
MLQLYLSAPQYDMSNSAAVTKRAHTARLAAARVHMCERKAACAMPGCTKTAVHMCSACESVYYCSPEHQMSHWPDHKVVCRPIAPTTVVRQPEASEPLPSEEELEPEA